MDIIPVSEVFAPSLNREGWGGSPEWGSWVGLLLWVSYKVIYFVPQNIIKRRSKYHPLKNKLIYFVVALIIQVT